MCPDVQIISGSGVNDGKSPRARCAGGATEGHRDDRSPDHSAVHGNSEKCLVIIKLYFEGEVDMV